MILLRFLNVGKMLRHGCEGKITSLQGKEKKKKRLDAPLSFLLFFNTPSPLHLPFHKMSDII